MGYGVLRTQYSARSAWSRVQLGPWEAGPRPSGSILQTDTLRPRQSSARLWVVLSFCLCAVWPGNPDQRVWARSAGLDMPEESSGVPCHSPEPPLRSPGLEGTLQA